MSPCLDTKICAPFLETMCLAPDEEMPVFFENKWFCWGVPMAMGM